MWNILAGLPPESMDSCQDLPYHTICTIVHCVSAIVHDEQSTATMPAYFTSVARVEPSLSNAHHVIIRARKPSATHLTAATAHARLRQSSNETLLHISAASGTFQQCRRAGLTAAGGHLQRGVGICSCHTGLSISALQLHEALWLRVFTVLQVLSSPLCMYCLHRHPDNLNTSILPTLPMDAHSVYAAHETCLTQHT